MSKKPIYTREEATLLLERFDDILEDYNIRLPSPEDDERSDDNSAAIYGSVYGDLLDHTENFLIDLLERHLPGIRVVTDVYRDDVNENDQEEDYEADY